MNIEKFLLLTAPHRSQITEVESLFVTARTALALLEFERTGTVQFVAADATKAWDLTNPLIRVDDSHTPDAVGLNDVFSNLTKFHNKRVSSALGNKKLDPVKGMEKEFARQGIVTGKPGEYRLVATDALERVQDDLGLALRGQRSVGQQDRILLEVIEAINASKLLLGSQRPGWTMAEFSQHVHEYPSGHPVVEQLVHSTSTMTGLMEKSKMAALAQRPAA